MVLTGPARPPSPAGTAERAVVVPDPAAWALWGTDLQQLGLAPTSAPAGAAALVVPRAVPEALEEAVRVTWEEIPPPRRLVELDGPALPGRPAADVLAPPSEAEHDDGGEANEAGGDESADEESDDGHDHGDMMEITGEPSHDGLVMETIELEHGPLAPALTGGLVLALELDGDVVARCEVRATLRATGPRARLAGMAPDPLAPVSWSVALGHGSGVLARSFADVVAVEWERALSHLLWLRSFGEVLGWDQLERRADAAAKPLIRARATIAGPTAPSGRPEEVEGVNTAPLLTAALDRTASLHDFLAGNRRLATRTRGCAVVDGREAERAGLVGPNARASGWRIDARDGDRLYQELGFQVRTAGAGDAEARTLQRAGEARDALELSLAALARTDSTGAPDSSATVESPRGPVQARTIAGADRPPAVSAPGAAAARAMAGDRAVDLEWASALTAIASFDLSPWSVPE